jgi:enamine deaminase RidA (YjgF/YER057c/UK114 family)
MNHSFSPTIRRRRLSSELRRIRLAAKLTSEEVARRADGTPVAPRDLAGQVAQALRNTSLGLAGAGASFADVLRLTFYVTEWSPEKIGDLMAGVEAVAGEVGLPIPMPPASLIGVDHLFEPDVLVEVEATALLD